LSSSSRSVQWLPTETVSHDSRRHTKRLLQAERTTERASIKEAVGSLEVWKLCLSCQCWCSKYKMDVRPLMSKSKRSTVLGIGRTGISMAYSLSPPASDERPIIQSCMVDPLQSVGSLPVSQSVVTIARPNTNTGKDCTNHSLVRVCCCVVVMVWRPICVWSSIPSAAPRFALQQRFCGCKQLLAQSGVLWRNQHRRSIGEKKPLLQRPASTHHPNDQNTPNLQIKPIVIFL